MLCEVTKANVRNSHNSNISDLKLHSEDSLGIRLKNPKLRQQKSNEVITLGRELNDFNINLGNLQSSKSLNGIDFKKSKNNSARRNSRSHDIQKTEDFHNIKLTVDPKDEASKVSDLFPDNWKLKKRLNTLFEVDEDQYMKEIFQDEIEQKEELDANYLNLSNSKLELESPNLGIYELQNMQHFFTGDNPSDKTIKAMKNVYVQKKNSDLNDFLNNLINMKKIRKKNSGQILREYERELVQEARVNLGNKKVLKNKNSIITFENSHRTPEHSENINSRCTNVTSTSHESTSQLKNWNMRGLFPNIEKNNPFFHKKAQNKDAIFVETGRLKNHDTFQEFSNNPKSSAHSKERSEIKSFAINPQLAVHSAENHKISSFKHNTNSTPQSKIENQISRTNNYYNRPRRSFNIQNVDQRSHSRNKKKRNGYDRTQIRSIPSKRRRSFDTEMNGSYFHINREKDTSWIRCLSSDSDTFQSNKNIIIPKELKGKGLMRILSKDVPLISSVHVSQSQIDGRGTTLHKYVNIRNTFGNLRSLKKNNNWWEKSDLEQSSLNQSSSKQNESVLFKRKIVTTGFENFLESEVKIADNSEMESSVVSNRIKRLINLSKRKSGRFC